MSESSSPDPALSRTGDLAIVGRYVQQQAWRTFGRTAQFWERLHPPTYKPAQRVYHTLRPSKAPKPQPDLPPVGTVLNFDNVRVRLDERLSVKQQRKLAEGRHTIHERTLILPNLRDNDVVMELGGGIGMLSASIARQIGSGRVHSYEANPELEPLIRDNYALNGVDPEINLCMLHREAGTATFHVSKNFSHSNAYVANDLTHEVQVPVKPLNHEIARIKPTVMIFDIQGAEGELLEFADLSTVRLLLVEMHPAFLGIRGTLALRRQLRQVGFEEFARQGQSFLYRKAAG